MTVEDEFYRFIKMKSILRDFEPPFKLSPSGPVDFIWHEKIVDTKSYFEMCEEYGGFFHHTEKTKTQDKYERYMFTLQFYKETFKEDPPKEFWPSPKEELRECLYCLKSSNPFDLENKKCGHFFCKSCLLNFIKYDKNCPLCNSSILEPFVVNCKFVSEKDTKDTKDIKLTFYKPPTKSELCKKLNEIHDVNKTEIDSSVNNFYLDYNSTIPIIHKNKPSI